MKTPQEYVKKFREKFPSALEGELDFEELVFKGVVKPADIESFLLTSLQEHGKQEYDRRSAELLGQTNLQAMELKRAFEHGEKKGRNDACDYIRNHKHSEEAVKGLWYVTDDIFESARKDMKEVMESVDSQIGGAVRKLGEV